jgi:ankyrin repeat protein
MDAVRDDDRALVRATLAAGEDVTQTNAYLRTPLHKAAYYSGDPGVIAELIDRGAIVDARDKGDWTPLHLATRNGHVGAMRVLLARGADATVADAKHGWTALHVAVVAGNAEGVEALVEAGADVFARDRSGADARTLAEECGMEDAVKVLSRTTRRGEEKGNEGGATEKTPG